MKAKADAAREKIIESIAEVDDKLIRKIPRGEQINNDELVKTLKTGIAAGKICPILQGPPAKYRREQGTGRDI